MDIFKDLWRFIGVVFLGLRDDSKAFIENLEAAERYTRWGDERKDIRDFQKALKHCEECNDKFAPKPDILLRKYATLFEILIGIIKLKIGQYIQKNDGVMNERRDMEKALTSDHKSLIASQATIEKLEKDGNMIKAKDERSHAEELDRNFARLEEDFNSNNPCLKLNVEYQKTMDECRKFKTRMELSFAAVQQLENIPRETLDSIIIAARSQLNAIDDELFALAPEGSESSDESSQTVSEATPPPTESP